MTPLPIKTKAAMYRLLERGALGNTVRMWRGLPAIRASGYRGLVSMRSLQVSNPVRLYHVPYNELIGQVMQLPSHFREYGLMFSEAPLDDKRSVQGEVMYGPAGLYLRYTTAPHPMRVAFDHEDKRVTGIAARGILRHHLWPADYDDLMELCDLYPGHVIEFSGFTVPVGRLRGRACLIWEVRDY